jgi:hypothetical protein
LFVLLQCPIVFVCVQYLIRVQSVRCEIDELGVCFHKRASERGSVYEREREREREVASEIRVGVCAETFLLRVRRGLKFFV